MNNWREHPNFAGPASTLLAIHDQFRFAAKKLREGQLHIFAPLAQTLHHHHHAEEVMLFPFVLKRTGVAPEQLVRDHEELTEAIEACARSLDADSIATFERVLIEHLDREEKLVVPVLLELSPADAWSAIHS